MCVGRTAGRRARPEEMRMDTFEARGGEKLQQDYLDRARELQPMLRKAGDEIERRREVTPEAVEAMIDHGIFKMLLPRSIGGAELDPLTYTAGLVAVVAGGGRPGVGPRGTSRR